MPWLKVVWRKHLPDTWTFNVLVFKKKTKHNVHFIGILQTTLFRRRGSVCEPAMQERSPVFRQCRRLRLHLQIRIFRSALWNRFEKAQDDLQASFSQSSVIGFTCDFQLGHSLLQLFIPLTDQTVCVLDKNKGCSQFCKPGYQTYECSCARGWKLQQKDKCVPAGEKRSTTTNNTSGFFSKLFHFCIFFLNRRYE